MQKNFFKLLIFAVIAFTFNFAQAKVLEESPHIFVEKFDEADWFLNGDKNFIFAGYGSPIFPDKKTHYLDYKSIKYGKLKDGRFIITCWFKDMYEFACFYPDKKTDGTSRARFMMRKTVDGNVNAFEVDSVLGKFNGVDLEPFPPLGTNLIPNRIAEMLYYIVKGEKYYGDLNPQKYLDEVNHKDILNPYTQNIYDCCKILANRRK